MALDVDAFSSTVLPVSSRMLMARLAAMFSMIPKSPVFAQSLIGCGELDQLAGCKLATFVALL